MATLTWRIVVLNLAAVQAFYGTDTVHPLAPPNAPAHVHEVRRLARETPAALTCTLAIQLTS